MNQIVNKIKVGLITLMLLSLQVMLPSTLLHAEDIDIFEVEKSTVPPNILFVMDVSGSMEWETGSDNTPFDPANSRLSVLKDALGTLLNDPDMTDMNVGMMSFSGHSGNFTAHGPAYPIADIDGDAQTILSKPGFTHPGNTGLPPTGGRTTRGYIQRLAEDWQAENGTPIVDALYEAALYFRGQEAYWGRHEEDENRAAHPATYDGALSGASQTVTTYECNTVSCTGAACNATQSCTTTTTIAKDCDTEPCSNGTNCAISGADSEKCDTGETSCGLGTNCTTSTDTKNRTCPSADIAACTTTNPTWYNCAVETIDTNCVTTCLAYDEFGNCSSSVKNCEQTDIAKCEEDIDTTKCDFATYQCDVDKTSCTHEVCGDVITPTGITGSALYKSPISEECQSNAIILLSDGSPTVNNSTSLIPTMIGSACDQSSGDGKCGPELAKFLAETDNSTTSLGNNIDGDQPINLYTIGFSVGNNQDAADYLKSLALAGGGSFTPASSADTLVKAFKEAISGVNDRDRIFSSAAYTPNPQSLLSHGDVVYLPVFNRENGAIWSGNLKKFKIKDGILIEGNSIQKVMDDKGRIRDDVEDMWAIGDLEHSVKSGGVASRLDPSTRNIQTDNGIGSLIGLTANNVTKVQLDVPNDADKPALIKYIKGWTEDDQARQHLGDIIHSKPVFVDYPNGERVIFVGTNEGFLHAFNDSDGTERFAYMPTELLKNIKKQKENQEDIGHLYGVDSEITIWKTATKTLLIFGLRRGGKAYYALDVTNINDPKLHWKITNSGDFDKLGFSWSKPKVSKIKHGGTVKDVVIFGGGYVDDNNGELDNSTNGTGSNVYIVDITDGTLIWKSPDAAIDYAIPGGVRVLDIDSNGLTDHLYFADTGGNIWRVDIKDTNDTDGVKLYKFAELGGTATPKRKFFNEPDVAFFRRAGRYVTSISIGSGERPKPLDKTSMDAFFVLLDKHPMFYTGSGSDVFDPSTDTIKITADLVEVTSLTTGLNKSIFNSEHYDKKGWYLNLPAGEKVLSSAITFENRIIFTSFSTNDTTAVAANTCDASSKNLSLLYILDLYSGKAMIQPKIVSPGEITEPPMPYYPPVKADECVKGDCKRKPQIILPRSDTPLVLPLPVNANIPKVYWLDQIR